ncbi:3-alpha,7-alpha,12-alpha-trihydroxy-5-beta-cholest-24-enoyl-CoA hydratase, partial [Streptomyces sp. SID8455]|nr:3-alpha,7-alpha,12-alpha-trihydroxy-5-beta-cholest-24-enoyl-CoA hydratase [Streptomyces sp. SID8455]
MPIDARAALAAEPRRAEIAWNHKDVQLYHLGLGAGTPATDPDELRYTLESRLQVLPAFATVAGAGTAAFGGMGAPGIDVDLAAVLHGGQTVRVHRPIPVTGRAVQTSKVAAVYDKGKAAVIVLRTEASDDEGPLWTNDAQIFVRGEGGFGGERGPSDRLTVPDRDPDRTIERPIREDQ